VPAESESIMLSDLSLTQPQHPRESREAGKAPRLFKPSLLVVLIKESSEESSASQKSSRQPDLGLVQREILPTERRPRRSRSLTLTHRLCRLAMSAAVSETMMDEAQEEEALGFDDAAEEGEDKKEGQLTAATTEEANANTAEDSNVVPPELHKDIRGENMDIYLLMVLVLIPTTGLPVLFGPPDKHGEGYRRGDGSFCSYWFGVFLLAMLCTAVAVMQLGLPFALLQWYQADAYSITGR